MPQPNFQTVRLAKGKHSSPEHGVCVMELASMIAGERFTDHPSSVCPVVAALLRSYNDVVDDDGRQDLYAYAASAVGTAGNDEARRARTERCAEELERLNRRQPALRRWCRGRQTPVKPASDVELERFTAVIARALRRGGPAGHAQALALIDELIAMGSVAERRPSRQAAKALAEVA
jgi:hypothetical protein